jgi:hypothetical protein
MQLTTTTLNGNHIFAFSNECLKYNKTNSTVYAVLWGSFLSEEETIEPLTKVGKNVFAGKAAGSGRDLNGPDAMKSTTLVLLDWWMMI